MGIYLLIGAGVIFAVIFALNNLIKTIFRRPLGFLDILLTFMTTLVLLAGLIAAQTEASEDDRIARAALLAGAGLAAFSLILLPLEVLRPERLKGSRGVLGMYSGLLLMLASIGVPYAAAYFTAQSQTASAPTSIVLAVTDSITETVVATEFVDPPNTATFTPTATNTPQPTETPSATLFHFSTRTPTLEPTLPTPCVASVQYNLRLRSAPDKTSDTLATIPFSTSIELYGKGIVSATSTPGGNDSLWWYTTYDSKQGWVDGQYLLVSTACDSLPTKETS